MAKLTKTDVRNDVLTFADIIVDYFNRNEKFTISISYESKDTVLIKVSSTYKNIKECKTAELKLTSFVIYYLHYEKYGDFQENGSFYIEHLSDTIDWLREPPSWITKSQVRQHIEDYKFRDFRFRGYPISLQQAVDYIPNISKKKIIEKGNTIGFFKSGNTIRFFKSSQEARDFYWELVEWLNS